MCPDVPAQCAAEGTANPVVTHAIGVHYFEPFVALIIIPMIIFGVILISYLAQRATND